VTDRCFLIEERDDGWRRLDTGELLEEKWPLSCWAWPVGAMWWWTHENGTAQELGPDPRPMPHLAVRTQQGRFCIDCASSDGTYWTRAGVPPDVTVTPSINIGPELWHGWLTDGALTP
jgi:hypothetical protein